MAQTNLLQNYVQNGYSHKVTASSEKLCRTWEQLNNNCLSVQFRELVSQAHPVYKPWWGDCLGCIFSGGCYQWVYLRPLPSDLLDHLL